MDSQVLRGNCFDVLPTLPTGQFQCVFLDPPYNIGLDYGNGSKADKLPTHDYLAQMKRLAELSVQRLTSTGSLWFLIPERWADPIGSLLTELLPRRNRIIWRETFGQYREDRFPPGHRHLFWHVMDIRDSPFYTDDIRVTSQRMKDGDPPGEGTAGP